MLVWLGVCTVPDCLFSSQEEDPRDVTALVATHRRLQHPDLDADEPPAPTLDRVAA